MAQQISKSKPLYVVTDKSGKFLSENEASYLKNYRVTFNKNASKAGEEGGNLGMGTPNQANVKYSLITLPAGDNMTMGVYECEETNEIYFANWNSNKLHGWYVIDGATMLPSIIMIDKRLDFSIEPAFKIQPHRVHVRVIYERTSDSTRKVKEKFLIYTDGHKWQRHISVIAAIRTDGFDATKYPYWKLRAPHYDADEFIDLPVRPPMFAPIVEAITPTVEDIGKPNTIIDKSIQFAYQNVNTDARGTTSSPYSNPVSIKSNNCNTNNNGLSRGYNVTLNAGSAMTERILLFVRFCGGDWYLYDTLDRFGPMEESLDNQYWLRTNDWAKYSYDADNNTITYQYFNDRQTGIIDQADFNRFQTDCPLISIGLAAAGDAILLADNLYGYNNIATKELEKFKVSIIDDDESGEILQSRKITLYAYLATNGSANQFIWVNGEDKTYRFGGVAYGNLFVDNVFIFSAQENDYLGLQLGDNKGFVAFLAGTDYFAVSKQILVHADGTMLEQLTIDALNNSETDLVKKLFQSGGYVMHKFEFIVPPGKYIARLSRHGVSTSSDYQKTSTYVIGQASKSKINGYKGVTSGQYTWDNTQLDTSEKELEIDVCSGDFDAWTSPTKNLFYIFVPYIFDTGGLIPNKRWRFIEGYVWEDDITKAPVEQLEYGRAPDGGLLQYLRYGFLTDHNGHFFMYMAEGTAYKGEVKFIGSANCQASSDIAFTKIRLLSHSDRGYYPDQDISMKDNIGSYGPCNRILIKGKIVDSNTGIGFSNVAVTSTKGPTTFTDSDGTFSLPVHERNGVNRKERIYINSSSGGCFIIPTSGNCFDLLPYDLTGVPCNNCTERLYLTTFNIKAKVLNQSIKSLKDGGSYTITAHIMDLAGRTTFEQELGTVDIPTFMERGAFILSKIRVDLLKDFVVPEGGAYLIFSISSNQRIQRYLQWVGDKIDFLDKNGNVTLNGTGAIRARITIQSLLDYNNQNNFSTTATYQFIKGDILRFYDDGNGKLLDPKNGGILDFPILGTTFNETIQGSVAVSTTADGTTTTTTTPVNNPGNTLIIGFDKRLLALNGISSTNDGSTDTLNGCGFWIEIQTPRDTSQVQKFCEIVGTYPIINNKLTATSFVLDTFDTYYQSRNIHISQCSGKAILHPFASTSISDYFGQACSSCGRLLIKDPMAEQKWYPTDIIKSDELVNEGRINGLGTFRASNRKQYKGQEMGGIVALHAQNKLLAVICELNWFVADYDNNFAQTTKDGLIVAMFTGELGEPDVKVRSKYGCNFEDTGTIIVNDLDGYLFFADNKNEGVIAMDYKTAYDISAIDNKGYFSDKFNFVNKHNQAIANNPDRLYHLFDKVFGYDYKMKELHVTFRLRQGLSSSPQFFANTERDKFIALTETFTFNIAQQRWNQFQTYAPEMYGNLRKSTNGQLMIAFAAGTPYLHNDKTVNNYNEFFGVSDTQVIELAFKIPGEDQYKRVIDIPGKDLTFQDVTIESPTVPYFVDRITTTNPNTLSYIPLAHFKRKKNIWYGPLLRDMASYPDAQHPVDSMLLDGGGKISGEFCKIRLVRDLERMNEYSEVDGIYCQYIGLEKSK